jgi:hypothetical protein
VLQARVLRWAGNTHRNTHTHTHRGQHTHTHTHTHCARYACGDNGLRMSEPGRKAYRTALTKHLHSLTGVEPTLTQRINKDGTSQWSVKMPLR